MTPDRAKPSRQTTRAVARQLRRRKSDGTANKRPMARRLGGPTTNGSGGKANGSSIDAEPIEDDLPPMEDDGEGSARTAAWARQIAKLRRESAEREAKRMASEAKRMMREAKTVRRRQDAAKRHRQHVQDHADEFGLDPTRNVLDIPEMKVHEVEHHLRMERGGNAAVRIVRDTQGDRFHYEVHEPQLTILEGEVLAFLRDTLVRTLPAKPPSNVDAEEVLHQEITQAITNHSVVVDDVAEERIRYYLVRDLLGFGPIDLLMMDPEIEDISCDGPGVPVYLYHRKHASIPTNVIFEEERGLDRFVIRMAQRSGKHISIADPLLDATLPDGSRLQATLGREVTSRGSSFTIRRFRDEPMTPPDLMRFGTWTDKMAAWFWFLMDQGGSLLMAGGTASGKTTTLNAVCQFIPPERKVISIEDTREINLRHENWIAGITRSGFGSRDARGRRAGSVDMFDLLAAALRQRPEHLLVGEVRGAEAQTLFQAMATGHAVASTMHADSVASAVYRLENEPINVPRLMLQTLDVVAIQRQVRVGGRIQRRVTEVTEIIGFEPDTGDLLTNTVFEWDPAGDEHRFMGKSYLLDRVRQHALDSEAEVEAEWKRRAELLEALRNNGRTDLPHVAAVLHHYYNDPSEALQMALGDLETPLDSTARLAATPAQLEKPAAPQSESEATTGEDEVVADDDVRRGWITVPDAEEKPWSAADGPAPEADGEETLPDVLEILGAEESADPDATPLASDEPWGRGESASSNQASRSSEIEIGGGDDMPELEGLDAVINPGDESSSQWTAVEDPADADRQGAASDADADEDETPQEGLADRLARGAKTGKRDSGDDEEASGP